MRRAFARVGAARRLVASRLFQLAKISGRLKELRPLSQSRLRSGPNNAHRKKLAAFSALGGGFLRFPIGDRRCRRRVSWSPSRTRAASTWNHRWIHAAPGAPLSGWARKNSSSLNTSAEGIHEIDDLSWFAALGPLDWLAGLLLSDQFLQRVFVLIFKFLGLEVTRLRLDNV